MLTDFHTHILPQVDDGSKSIEESLQMLRMEYSQNVRRVVLTPHFYPWEENMEKYLEKREHAYKKLLLAMEGKSELPEICLAAEVHYFKGMSDSRALSNLTIGDSPYILIEMPMTRWTDEMYAELEAVYHKQGLIPVIAHLDRYIKPFRTYGIPRRLASMPAIVQVNTSFFLRRSTKRMALRYLQKGLVQLIGSDCHHCYVRPPVMGAAQDVIIKYLGEEVLANIRSLENTIFSQDSENPNR